MNSDGNRRLQQLLVDVFGIVVPDVPALYRSEDLRCRLASLCCVILLVSIEVKRGLRVACFVGHTLLVEDSCMPEFGRALRFCCNLKHE